MTFAVAEALHFAAEQDHAAFDRVDDFVMLARFAIVGDQFAGQTLLSRSGFPPPPALAGWFLADWLLADCGLGFVGLGFVGCDFGLIKTLTQHSG